MAAAITAYADPNGERSRVTRVAVVPVTVEDLPIPPLDQMSVSEVRPLIRIIRNDARIAPGRAPVRAATAQDADALLPSNVAGREQISVLQLNEALGAGRGE
jgi:hypothetical protein